MLTDAVTFLNALGNFRETHENVVQKVLHHSTFIIGSEESAATVSDWDQVQASTQGEFLTNTKVAGWQNAAYKRVWGTRAINVLQAKRAIRANTASPGKTLTVGKKIKISSRNNKQQNNWTIKRYACNVLLRRQCNPASLVRSACPHLIKSSHA